MLASERKVRTPESRIPREEYQPGALRCKIGVTESVTENKLLLHKCLCIWQEQRWKGGVRAHRSLRQLSDARQTQSGARPHTAVLIPLAEISACGIQKGCSPDSPSGETLRGRLHQINGCISGSAGKTEFGLCACLLQAGFPAFFILSVSPALKPGWRRLSELNTIFQVFRFRIKCGMTILIPYARYFQTRLAAPARSIYNTFNKLVDRHTTQQTDFPNPFRNINNADSGIQLYGVNAG